LWLPEGGHKGRPYNGYFQTSEVGQLRFSKTRLNLN